MDNLNTLQNYFAHVLHCTCLADMLRIASFDRPGCRLGQNALPHTHNQSVWRSQQGSREEDKAAQQLQEHSFQSTQSIRLQDTHNSEPSILKGTSRIAPPLPNLSLRCSDPQRSYHTGIHLCTPCRHHTFPLGNRCIRMHS